MKLKVRTTSKIIEAKPSGTGSAADSLYRKCARANFYQWKNVSHRFGSESSDYLVELKKSVTETVIKKLKSGGVNVYNENSEYDYTKSDNDVLVHPAVNGLPESDQWHILKVMFLEFDEFQDTFKGVIPERVETVAGLLMKASKLKRALFILVCTKTGEVRDLRLKYKAKSINDHISKYITPLKSGLPPIEDTGNCYACPFSNICGGWEVPAVSCSTCYSSCNEEICDAGLVQSLYERTGCKKHRYRPDLLTGAEFITEVEDSALHYKIDGHDFYNCIEGHVVDCGVTSKELKAYEYLVNFKNDYFDSDRPIRKNGENNG